MINDIFLFIYLPVIVWVLLMVILFYYLVRKYPLGDWDEENPNPYQGETFAMPRGVMRGMLTLSLIFIVMLMEVVNLKMPEFEDLIEKLLVAFQMMIAFYFGSKVMHHVTKADERKARARAEAAKALQTPVVTETEDAEG